jgi:hypothetical protein
MDKLQEISLGTLPSDETEKAKHGVLPIPGSCARTWTDLAEGQSHPLSVAYKRRLRSPNGTLSPRRTLSRLEKQLILTILPSL